jgi:choline dehydrogenase-like flavoprotein
MATKKLTLRPDSIVTHLLFDEKKHRVAGLEVLDSQSNERHTYYAKIIFLCASTIGSTWILLNSRPPQYPEGIGASSGVLGHYLMDHHQRAGASAKVEGFDDKYYLGRRPNGIYVPRFRNVGNDKRNYLRGFGYQGAASRESWQRVIAEAGFGADFKEKATEPGDWTMGLWGFGEGLPYFENQVHLNFDKKDKWGLPTLNFDAEFKENERLMRLDMANDAAEMLEAAGCKNVRPYNEMTPPGHSIHEMGTARMGNDPKQSVLNKHNQVHDCPNVFVTDGSFMVSASCVNPSLTYMAFTARAADYAVKELKAQRL